MSDKERSTRDLEKVIRDDEESRDDDKEDSSELLVIQQILKMRLNAGKIPQKKKLLTELSIDGIVEYIKSGKATKIITMAGAGISTSAGIPDFRSPGTGLYSNLQKYNLPDPQAIFEIGYFRENPEPFFQLAKELYPDGDKFRPTPSHFFIKLLHDKGLLHRHYTQNVDTLERLSGIPEEKLIEAHGTFHSAHCLDKTCNTEYSQKWVKEKLFVDEVTPTCEKCNSVVKPDIVFFGENLPEKFYRNVQKDFKECDLLIVMGTSLTVQPFASLVNKVSDECPRLMINRNICGPDYEMTFFGLNSFFDFNSDNAYRDVALLGTTDESCKELCKHLGWEDDLDKMLKESSQPVPKSNKQKSESKSLH